MVQTSAGAKKAAVTVRERWGESFYKMIGAKRRALDQYVCFCGKRSRPSISSSQYNESGCRDGEKGNRESISTSTSI